MKPTSDSSRKGLKALTFFEIRRNPMTSNITIASRHHYNKPNHKR